MSPGSNRASAESREDASYQAHRSRDHLVQIEERLGPCWLEKEVGRRETSCGGRVQLMDRVPFATHAEDEPRPMLSRRHVPRMG